MSKTTKPKWVTEAEICNAIEAKQEELLYVNPYTKLYREFEIGHHRADFILFGARPLEIVVIEVKITADIWAIDQCAKYVRLLEEQLSWWSASTGNKLPISVRGEVWARWIDESVWNVAQIARIGLSRIAIESDGTIGVSVEPYPLLLPTLQENVSDALNSLVVTHG